MALYLQILLVLSLSASISSATSSNTSKDTPIVSKSDLTIYVKSVMDDAIAKTDDIITKVIEKRLVETGKDANAKFCLSTCKAVYHDATKIMKRIEEEVRAEEYIRAVVDIEVVTNKIDGGCSSCVSTFEIANVDVAEFEKWVESVAADCRKKINTPNLV